MVQFKRWQWVVLVLPIALVVVFLLIAAGQQIHTWGLNWIWGVFTLLLVGWRWLLVRWTNPVVKQVDAIANELSQELDAQLATDMAGSLSKAAAAQADAQLQAILEQAQQDRPIWEDWPAFWQRCQSVVVAIAHLYHPEVKYPLLNIYVPQAYGLIRGTVDDVDAWMQRLSPVLNQVTVGQAYQAYEIYQKLEPSARKIWKVWNWAQWLLNPVAAAARQASQPSSDRATQQLLVNLGQQIREVALRNLARQAIILYSGEQVGMLTATTPPPAIAKAKTQTVREILEQAQPVDSLEQAPINILLVGRTGAGKSSLINTLFQTHQAEVDVLPSTDAIQSYTWTTPAGESLTLWDTPGYEQVNRADLRDQVLDYAETADFLLLVTPALDPALQIDLDFLKDVKADAPDLPVIVLVTQVDRLRPMREWNPPYDWQWGDRPKEIAIREATEYRVQSLGEWCDRVLPLVTADMTLNRAAWGDDLLSLVLVEAIAPAKQFRFARFLQNLDARTVAAAQIIDRYSLQVTTTHGVTALLKRPTLQFISTLTTGSPALAYVLAEKVPLEQAPIFMGKLQMAYDLFSLLSDRRDRAVAFDLLALFPLLLENAESPNRNVWAFGHALLEYWTQDLPIEQLQHRFNYYLANAPSS